MIPQSGDQIFPHCGRFIVGYPHICVGFLQYGYVAAVIHGCICSVDAEKTCRDVGCSQRNPLKALPIQEQKP